MIQSKRGGTAGIVKNSSPAVYSILQGLFICRNGVLLDERYL